MTFRQMSLTLIGQGLRSSLQPMVELGYGWRSENDARIMLRKSRIFSSFIDLGRTPGPPNSTAVPEIVLRR